MRSTPRSPRPRRPSVSTRSRREPAKRASRLSTIVHEMLLYKFNAAIPWRVALSKDESGENLPDEGAPWRADGSVQLESGTTFMGVPLNEVLGTIERNGYFVWVRTPQ